MNKRKLSDRVCHIVDLVPECDSMADVGCDHALISIYLREIGRVKKVIASDLREKPLENARENVEKKGLTTDFQFRLCDGLSAYKPHEVETILISGLGGILMKEVLDKGKEVVKSATYLILEPQSDVYLVRKWLREEGFVIKEERFAREGIKYYPVIRAEKGDIFTEEGEERIFDKFGALLLKEKNRVLKEFLIGRREHFSKIITEGSLVSSSNEGTEERLIFLKEELKDVEKALEYFN